ncbi:expressed unknown protein [Seminavis robusta]|uniref:Uncharacterized protein n=1 Tax=Seminavis robusta TaxID=568900 RepID=A0A9N8DH20_9STRA|nr:expressed unknown protein [Seminavis robusta]|eukprot:Sro149_g068320.1 n/a (149) ;mRNA; r:13324-13770
MPQVIDAGVANHSVSATFMKLVNVHHEMDLADFEEIVKFLKENIDGVIHDVHKMDKLILDDGETMLNCPPAPEAKDSHGNELIRTLSEKQTSLGIAVKREVKVHVLGPDPDDATKTRIEIREDMVKGGEDGKPVFTEHRETISIARNA